MAGGLEIRGRGERPHDRSRIPVLHADVNPTAANHDLVAVFEGQKGLPVVGGRIQVLL